MQTLDPITLHSDRYHANLCVDCGQHPPAVNGINPFMGDNPTHCLRCAERILQARRGVVHRVKAEELGLSIWEGEGETL